MNLMESLAPKVACLRQFCQSQKADCHIWDLPFKSCWFDFLLALIFIISPIHREPGSFELTSYPQLSQTIAEVPRFTIAPIKAYNHLGGGGGMGPYSKQLIGWHLTLIYLGSSLLCDPHCLGGDKSPLCAIISLLEKAASLSPVYFLWASNLA